MAKKKHQLIVEKRKVYRIGGSLMIGLPPEFTAAHNIQEGDMLPVLANHILKIVPMPEEDQEITEEKLGEKAVLIKELLEGKPTPLKQLE